MASFPLPNQHDLDVIGIDQEPVNSSPKIPKYEDSPGSSDEKVISVRITSSVAVGRGNGKLTQRHPIEHDLKHTPSKISPTEIHSTTIISLNEEITQMEVTEVPPNLIGANIEYIKQLNAKKETREHTADPVHPFELLIKDHRDNDGDTFQREPSAAMDEYDEDIEDIPLARKVASTAEANRFQGQKANLKEEYQNVDMNSPGEYYDRNHNINVTSDSLLEPPTKFGLRINSDDNRNFTNSPIVDQKSDKKETRGIDQLTRIESFVSNSHNDQTDDSVAESSIKSVDFAKYNEEIENIPPRVTIPAHSANNVQGLSNRPLNKGRNNRRLTTVSFNIVHDTPQGGSDSEPSTSYISSSQIVPNQQSFYEPPKVYSEPAKIYSEPAKVYSEPAKIYSEPAKIYSEPAKVYSEPAKIYSEPSKFYSEPASLHLDQNFPSSIAPNYSPWQRQPQGTFGGTTMNTTPINSVTNGFQIASTEMEHHPEKNYEVDEKDSVLTDGRSHGVQQETSTEKCKQDNCKVGYVVEGRQFKKYRVEERTPDGFIVGEYGVVRNEDGALRGVRYTADSDASPRLIHDALMKFLQLK